VAQEQAEDCAPDIADEIQGDEQQDADDKNVEQGKDPVGHNNSLHEYNNRTFILTLYFYDYTLKFKAGLMPAGDAREEPPR